MLCGRFAGLSAASLCSVVTSGNGRHAGVDLIDLYLTRIKTVIYDRENGADRLPRFHLDRICNQGVVGSSPSAGTSSKFSPLRTIFYSSRSSIDEPVSYREQRELRLIHHRELLLDVVKVRAHG